MAKTTAKAPRRHAFDTWLRWAIAFTWLPVAGCLFDSSYFQQKAAQRNVAQQQTPRTLEATPGAPQRNDAAAARARVLRVRVYATQSHAAEVALWPRQIERLIEDANRVLVPTLAVRFEVSESRTWPSKLSSDALDPLLAELRALDAGDDVDAVLGLTGSLPIFARSFHQLGIAEIGGKHLVMRAMNDAREREAIEIELSRLGAEERESLYQVRKRHKATAVLLHELGHTLGSIHEVDTRSIMSSHYDKEMTSFGGASAELMRMAAPQKWREAEVGAAKAAADREREARLLAERLLEHYERTRASWVPLERDAMVATLRAQMAAASRPRPTEPTATLAPSLDDDAAKSIGTEDRVLFSQSIEDERGGRVGAAWARAEPLFARYPDVYAVQDMRCRLALKLSSDWQVTRQHCEKLMDLSRSKAPKAK